MLPMGGTELLAENLFRQVGSWPAQLNLIISACDSKQLDSTKKNIVWQHLDVDQSAAQGAADPNFQNLIHKWIFVSEWQRQTWVDHFGLDITKTCVIRNAIPSITFKAKPNSKDGIRLIYTSTPWRGLDILLDALELIDHKNWNLTVYSSTIIYGKSFSDSVNREYQQLFDRCKRHPQIKYVGYGTNSAVRTALQHSHIMTYPSVFRETSCLSVIEAAAAGCQVITTDLGALKETLQGDGILVSMPQSRQQLVHDYAAALDQQLNCYSSDSAAWCQQAEKFDKLYNWTYRIQEWKQQLNQILEE